MIRLQPTVISLTMSEVKDLETRRRYLRYLRREENPTSEETVQRKSSPSLGPRKPRSALGSSQNRESSSSPKPAGIDPLPSSPLERIIDEVAEDGEPTPTPPRQELNLALALAQPEPRFSLESLDSPSRLHSPSSTGRYLSARPRRPRLFQSSSDSDRLTSGINALASAFEQRPSPRAERVHEDARNSETTADTHRHHTVSILSLPQPFSQKPRRVSTERTWTRTLVSRSTSTKTYASRDPV